MAEEKYDFSWDEGNDDLWDQKYEEWQERDWLYWLSNKLVFPFEVERKEDLYSNPFVDTSKKPFSVGHVMKAILIEDEDDDHGIIVKVREGRKTGYLPLADLEVTSREDSNFWLVREYVVWFANR